MLSIAPPTLWPYCMRYDGGNYLKESIITKDTSAPSSSMDKRM